ncbi:hypothetical protein tloyanaT_05220 [Thalassotalea loyana]|uniref:Uncharacterized protein n=1 Tax=Thalassotalea loyana TaxID=280483 RepID=A0ABQ6H7Z8_9GAMM|nr:hypothetical protein tloyanaT_05220 [Thalassotalea loyana]
MIKKIFLSLDYSRLSRLGLPFKMIKIETFGVKTHLEKLNEQYACE